MNLLHLPLKDYRLYPAQKQATLRKVEFERNQRRRTVQDHSSIASYPDAKPAKNSVLRLQVGKRLTIWISCKRQHLAMALFGIPVFLVLPPSLPMAHDHWMSRQQYRDPATNAWCCDENDCRVLDDASVNATAGGFVVDRELFVEWNRVLPSSDGNYWACFNEESKGPHERKRNVRCFFAPANS